MRQLTAPVVMAGLVTAIAGSIAAPTAASQTVERPDITYAVVDGRPLQLDLYMPEGLTNPPLVVWVHGGAWRSGSRTSVRREFAEHGFATASVDYRLSPEAAFPAMVHDIKAAIRYLRAHAGDYGYRADSIAIAGDSAGGHLAALVGVSSGVEALEGTVGTDLDASSAVQAIVDYYGASNLTTILQQSTPYGLDVRVPALELLLGGVPEQVPDQARLASVTTHVDKGDPPLLIFHGDQDPQMPINQSHELEGAYAALGLDVDFIVLHGAGHGGDEFYSGPHLERAITFLQRTVGSGAP